MCVAAEIPAAFEEVTVDQPAARMALAAAAAEPFHAYLLAGPPGSGKGAAARALAAELPAGGAPDPDDARRRTLADPSPHPDLVWLRPPGIQHLVEDVRQLVIAAAPAALGDIRPALSDGVRESILAEMPKDLTNIPVPKLAEHFDGLIAV